MARLKAKAISDFETDEEDADFFAARMAAADAPKPDPISADVAGLRKISRSEPEGQKEWTTKAKGLLQETAAKRGSIAKKRADSFVDFFNAALNEDAVSWEQPPPQARPEAAAAPKPPREATVVEEYSYGRPITKDDEQVMASLGNMGGKQKQKPRPKPAQAQKLELTSPKERRSYKSLKLAVHLGEGTQRNPITMDDLKKAGITDPNEAYKLYRYWAQEHGEPLVVGPEVQRQIALIESGA
jgi:hypothetical protein